MSASLAVFVCSTYSDLIKERNGVLDAIRRLQQSYSSMEFFGARNEQPIETCLAEVRKSDVLVVIVGHMYGSLVPDLEISFSQAEYEEGVRLEKTFLVYIRDDKVRILPDQMEPDPDKRKRLVTWKQSLRSSHTVKSFQSGQKLAVQVAADLGHVLLVAEISRAKGVSAAPLREVLKRLGETEVAESKIPERLARAADELLRLRAKLGRHNNDQPEFAAIRARASALIDKGDFDAARGALNEGREAARRSEAGFLADEARIDRLQLNYDAACAKFAEAASLDPNDVQIRIELGDLWVTRGSLTEARKAFVGARDAAARSGDERDLSVSYNRIGEVQFAQGNLAGALESYSDSLGIRDRLAKSGPGNADWQRDLSVSYAKIGDVQFARGDLAGALESYSDSLAILEGLATSDPGNDRQSDLSVAYAKIGDVQFKQSDLTGALKSYHHDLEIAERLATSDPDNAGWQRDLSVSYERVGDAQRAQRNFAGALESYGDSFAIRDGLAKSDPDNAGRQFDLGIGNERIGDVHLDQGDYEGALTSYRAKFAIIDRLTESDPDNAGWQRDLAVSHAKIGNAFFGMGNLSDASNAFGRGHAIMVRLTALSPENVDWKLELKFFEQKLSLLK